MPVVRALFLSQIVPLQGSRIETRILLIKFSLRFSGQEHTQICFTQTMYVSERSVPWLTSITPSCLSMTLILQDSSEKREGIAFDMENSEKRSLFSGTVENLHMEFVQSAGQARSTQTCVADLRSEGPADQ